MIAQSNTPRTTPTEIDRGIAALMLAVVVSLTSASLIHFGLHVPIGFVTIHEVADGAAVPEALIAVVLLVGAGSVIAHLRTRWPIALGTSLFALLGVFVGLRFTLMDGQTGDVVYHLCLLAALITLLTLILSPAGRQSLRDR